MVQKFDIALQAKINDFKKRFNINNIKEEDIFEEFSNYTIMSNEAQKEIENINSVSTNKAEGIDGIGIFINNRLITEESDLDKIGENEKLNIKLCFVQSTTNNNFDGKKFKAYIDKVIDFLVEKFNIEPFSTIYKKLLDEESDYIDNLLCKPEVILYFVSARTNHTMQEDEIENERKKFEKREDLNYKVKLKSIKFIQNEEINKLYENINKFHNVQLTFDNVMQLDEKNKIPISLISVFTFKELKEMILTSDNNLREHLFVENPRSFIGYTDINKSIKETLEDNSLKEYFLYLNNGLTILCDLIENHKTKKNTYILKYPRIINGCQTTHILYEAFKEGLQEIDNIEITAKIIATKDDNLKEYIIFTTNNQNSINKDLQSLNDFLKDLEEYFNGFNRFELFFERLRGQYSNINPPYKKINIEDLAKIYISIFFQEPHKMKSNAIKKINEYREKKEIFKMDDHLNKYFYCAILFYWMNNKIINQKLKLKSKTMDMHFLLACNLFLENKKKIKDTEEKINFVIEEKNIDDLFLEVNLFLEKQEYLFEKRGFYSGPKTKKLIEAISNE